MLRIEKDCDPPNGKRAAQLVKILPQLEEVLSKSTKIAIKTKRRILFVDPADMVIIEAQGNYALLRQSSGSYLLRESISTIAEAKSVRIYTDTPLRAGEQLLC